MYWSDWVAVLFITYKTITITDYPILIIKFIV